MIVKSKLYIPRELLEIKSTLVFIKFLEAAHFGVGQLEIEDLFELNLK